MTHLPERPTPPRRRLALLALLGGALMPQLALADDTEAAPASLPETPDTPAHSALHISGFATLGLTYNDNASTGLITSYAQAHPARTGLSGDLDSVLGVQAVWTPLKGTSVTVQGVVRPDEGMKPQLRMAYLRQELGELAIRGGRIRSPLYFDSDVSEVGFAYLSARPPIPLYTTVNSVDTIDGADVQWRHGWTDVAVLAQGYFGYSHYDHHFYNQGFAAHAALKGIKGGAISLILPTVTFRASRTWIASYTMRGGDIDTLDAGLQTLSGELGALSANPYLPSGYGVALATQAGAIAGLVNPFDSKPIYTSVGFDGTWGHVRAMGEWAELNSQSRMVGKYQGYQLTLGYMLGNVTPYATYSRQRRLAGSIDTSALAATGLNAQLDAGLTAMQQALAQASSYANLSSSSITAGARWDVREHVAIKAQYDRLYTPGSGVPGTFAVDSLPIRNTTNLVTVTLNLVF